MNQTGIPLILVIYVYMYLVVPLLPITQCYCDYYYISPYVF